MFLLYKLEHQNSKISFTGIFEMEEDAKKEMKRLTEDYTPEEQLKETFYIKEIPYTSTEEYNRIDPPMRYCEEDYDGDEENEDIDKDRLTNENFIVDNSKPSDEIIKKIMLEHPYDILDIFYVAVIAIIFHFIHIFILYL